MNENYARLRMLSDQELNEILTGKRQDYTPEEIAAAEDEAARRGGIAAFGQRLNERLGWQSATRLALDFPIRPFDRDDI
jgi:hypothetical protein